MSYTDWNSIVNYIEDTKNKTILELGCGKGTQTLVDNFKQVYSWETWKDDEWWEYSNKQYSTYHNWKGFFKDFNYWGFDKTEAELHKSGGSSRNPIALNKYWDELTQNIDLSTINVAFVDQGFHLRGETVNKFIKLGVEYIFWHDAHTGHKLYGWDLIKIPNTYKQIIDLPGQGTILIKKL